MFSTIIANWHIWEGSAGQIMVSNEDTGKLYSAAGIDMAINLLYMEAGMKVAKQLQTQWKDRKHA